MAIRCAECSRWLTPEESNLPCPRCGSMDRKVFPLDQALADEKAQIAKDLATKHFRAEAGLRRIFRLLGNAEVEARPVEPIKLLEVNANTVESGVLPVQFGPSPKSGVPYPSVIVEVSPEEFLRIDSKELILPKGWKIGEEISRPLDEPGEG